MRKFKTKSIVALALASMLALSACSGKSNPADTATTEASTEATTQTPEPTEETSEPEQEVAQGITNDELTAQLRQRYAGGSEYEILEPMFNLPEDYIFEFPNAAEKYSTVEGRDGAIEVFIDSELKYPFPSSYVLDFDYDNGTLQVKPASIFSAIPIVTDDSWGVWGNAPKLWLKINEDIETGNKLEKPQVAMFTIRRELNTPTVSFSVSETGYAQLSWRPVENATKYEVYQLSGSTEKGLTSSMLHLAGETTECIFSDFDGKTFAVDSKDLPEGEQVLNQNAYFENPYIDPTDINTMPLYLCVIAYDENGNHSNVSNFISMADAMRILGRRISYKAGSDQQATVDLMSQLPATQPLEMCSKEITARPVDYRTAHIVKHDVGSVTVYAKLYGTNIDAMLYAREVDENKSAEDILAALIARQDQLTAGGMISPNVDIEYVPDSTTEGTDTGSASTESTTADTESTTADTESTTASTDSSSEATTSDSGASDQAGEEQTSDAGSGAGTDPGTGASTPQTTMPEGTTPLDLPGNIPLFANSALSEYLATNMLAHNETIPLAAWPEALDSDVLLDALMEAYRQNALIGSIRDAGFDYTTSTLFVEYEYTKEQQRNMQEGVLAEVDRVVAEVIDGSMSDWDKANALNTYLCETAEYDTAALANGELHNFEYADPEFADSFTPAGVLLNKVGVCASYAGAYHLLANKAGVDCVVVTGEAGGIGHAWNRVNIGNQWAVVDVTTNDTDLCANAVLFVPDEVMRGYFVEEPAYLLDNELYKMRADSYDDEFYRRTYGYVPASELQSFLLSQLGKGGSFTFRTDSTTDENELAETFAQALVESGKSPYDIENIGLFLGVMQVEMR